MVATGFRMINVKDVPSCRYDTGDDRDHAVELALDKPDYANAIRRYI